MNRIVLLALLGLCGVPSVRAAEETLSFGSFGTVHLYRRTPRPAQVLIFVSGDGGWNEGVVDMAGELAGMDALVIGVDIGVYLQALARSPKSCLYPAADFEALSKFVQKKLEYPAYVTPILSGYSSGATLVYVTLVQAPPNTFAGGISMGFCPDLLLSKPLCRGNGLEWRSGPRGKGYIFLPAATLEVPWVALQGTMDQVCDAKATAEYVGKVPRGELVLLPKVGHGFSVPRNWLPQLRDAFKRIAAANRPSHPAPAVESLADLPLIEVPATQSAGGAMAVVISGDGGWGVTDRGIAEGLAQQGIPAVGWNSLQYFWSAKTPERAARDLERILRSYLSLWNRSHAVIVGYSLGADVAPFMISRLPEDVRSRIDAVALLGPGGSADFEFHLTDWLVNRRRPTSQPVLPEIRKLRGIRVLCFFGKDDSDAICRDLAPDDATPIELGGGHRIGRQYQPVIDAVLKALR